jgi:type I restriction enzyme M protein
MYLHGFTDPHIYEYDTLTSEERWNEFADVILANPPFMSPKGGIKPHKRFSIQAKRSEVLFVDYMAEHLTPTGRAGIIVPEGIIFQSQTAYKDLRKLLVENSLVAVVSLPAGCFNPYSGVKTSILILDKSLARQSDTIAFFKVENDGFGLGAQRRAFDKNDLPQVQAELAAYLQALRSHQPTADLEPACGLIVPKEKIAANGDYNLSGERYGDQTRLLQAKWPTVSLGEMCTFMTGGTPTSTVAEYYEGGTVPWLVSGDIHGFEIWDCEKRITPKAVENSNARVLPKDSVLIALNGQGKTRGTVALLRMEGATCNQSLVAITPAKPPRAISEFIFWTLRSMYSDIRGLTGDTERSGLNIPILKSIQIPLPPLEVQKEIVAEIEGYQKVINGARAVLDHYRPHIPIHPDWPMVALGDQLLFVSSGATPKGGNETYVSKGVLFIRSQNILCGSHDFSDAAFISEETHEEMSRSQVKYGDVFLNITGASIGRSAWMDLAIPANVNQHVAILRVGPELNRIFLSLFLNSDTGQRQILSFQAGASREALNYGQIRQLTIPLPPLATQQAIVAEIEAEQALVAANRELITRFEQKIQATLARIWGEETGGTPK